MPTNTVSFTDEESQKLKIMAEYYRIAKELIIYGEQIDPDNVTLAQTLNERTNALDHIMRVFIQKLGMRNEPSTDPDAYCRANLEKAHGHIYRVVYDALDWVSLTIKDRIVTDLEPYSLETINAVMPEYFKDIKPNMESLILNDISRLRSEKDVANNNEENLRQLAQTILKIKQYFDQIRHRIPSLSEYERKVKKKQRSDRAWEILVGVGLLIAGWLLGHFIK